MDRFLEESVSKHHRAAEEVLYYASWVVMIVSAILAFMYLNVMFYSFSISMLVMTLLFVLEWVVRCILVSEQHNWCRDVGAARAAEA